MLFKSSTHPALKKTSAIEKISRSAVIWQLIACVAVVLPLIQWLPLWVLLLGGGCIAARLMIHSGRWSFPHWSIRFLLVVAVAVGLLTSFNRDASLNAMVALLTVGLALKLLEIYRRRDALVLLYVALFLSATVFLFEQSILVALYMFFALGLVVAALVSVWQDPLREDMLRPLKQAWKLLLPSLPLMLVLFFIFPRIGPLWSVELDRSSARTGLSESMSPGDISRLTRSDELAFRAVFNTEPPLPTERYWRALVLSSFDGREWTPGSPPQSHAETLIPLSEPITYEIVQERSHQRWLFALDMPISAPSQAQLTSSRTLLSNQEVTTRIQYSVTSVERYQLAPNLDQTSYAFFTQIPRNSNPRTQILAQQWFDEADQNVPKLIEQMFRHFNETFVYTLEPQPLGRHSVDEFLFDTQQGFCEHYASAAAFLLRSVGVPARVVTGYQGGEWNASQNYLTIRQFDAHAWVEVWLEDRGWVRIDPTTAVAPERIEMSADSFFSGQPGFLADSPLISRVGRQGWLLNARMQYDALNFAWQRWVLNYHHQQQNLLQDWLGDLTPWKLILLLFLPASLVLGFVAWRLLGRREALDPLDRELRKLLTQLEAYGITRQSDETLQRLVVRLSDTHPEFAKALQPVAEAYEALHYAPSDASQMRLRLMQQLVLAQQQLK